MSSAAASFVLRRALCRPRFYSSLASRVLAPRALAKACPAISARLASRVLAPRALAKACPAISARLASSLAVTDHEEKIKRADITFLRVLVTEIEFVKDEEDFKKRIMPKDFPFVIIDTPGDKSIVLMRHNPEDRWLHRKPEFSAECIQVTVSMEHDESSHPLNLTIYLQGTIIKGTGPTLGFSCHFNSGRLHISNISVKRPDVAGEKRADREPSFCGRDETLEKAFRKYLSARGINASLYNPLLEYMRRKHDREYLTFLYFLRGFVAK